jgi:hypothetical protein
MGSLNTTPEHTSSDSPAGGRRPRRTKTAAGRRTVPVAGLIAEVLDQHLHRNGLVGEADALVFSAARGGRRVPPTGDR